MFKSSTNVLANFNKMLLVRGHHCQATNAKKNDRNIYFMSKIDHNEPVILFLLLNYLLNFEL